MKGFPPMKNAKRLLSLAAGLAVASTFAVYAGEGCPHMKDAANKGDDMGEHCMINKNVAKSAQMTHDGAIVTLAGKNDEAVKMLKTHLEAHQKGEPCPDCPLSMKDVKTSISMTDKGGTLTFVASSPEALKAVQDWANSPSTAGCCGKDKMKEDKTAKKA
jgi:hypothetical protein